MIRSIRQDRHPASPVACQSVVIVQRRTRAERRPTDKARRPSISSICEGGATQSAGMHRRPNAAGVSLRATQQPGVGRRDTRTSWGILTRPRSHLRSGPPCVPWYAPLRYSLHTNDYQWINKVTAAAVDHYVFAHLNQTTVALTRRLSYTLRPTLSVQLFAAVRLGRRVQPLQGARRRPQSAVGAALRAVRLHG
jgi:hypothetical protein